MYEGRVLNDIWLFISFEAHVAVRVCELDAG